MKKAVHCGGVDDVDVGARANVKRSLVLQSWSSLFEKKKQASRAHNEKKKKNFHLQPIHHILRVRSKSIERGVSSHFFKFKFWMKKKGRRSLKIAKL